MKVSEKKLDDKTREKIQKTREKFCKRHLPYFFQSKTSKHTYAVTCVGFKYFKTSEISMKKLICF